MLGPVLVVAVVLGFLIAARLSTYHGNAAGFVLFGQRYVHYTHPPAGAPINSPDGYDGQFYWLQATDPLLLHHSTLADIHNTAPGYHLQRPAYPALAYALAAGHAQRTAVDAAGRQRARRARHHRGIQLLRPAPGMVVLVGTGDRPDAGTADANPARPQRSAGGGGHGRGPAGLAARPLLAGRRPARRGRAGP